MENDSHVFDWFEDLNETHNKCSEFSREICPLRFPKSNVYNK